MYCCGMIYNLTKYWPRQSYLCHSCAKQPSEIWFNKPMQSTRNSSYNHKKRRTTKVRICLLGYSECCQPQVSSVLNIKCILISFSGILRHPEYLNTPVELTKKRKTFRIQHILFNSTYFLHCRQEEMSHLVTSRVGNQCQYVFFLSRKQSPANLLGYWPLIDRKNKSITAYQITPSAASIIKILSPCQPSHQSIHFIVAVASTLHHQVVQYASAACNKIFYFIIRHLCCINEYEMYG